MGDRELTICSFQRAHSKLQRNYLLLEVLLQNICSRLSFVLMKFLLELSYRKNQTCFGPTQGSRWIQRLCLDNGGGFSDFMQRILLLNFIDSHWFFISFLAFINWGVHIIVWQRLWLHVMLHRQFRLCIINLTDDYIWNKGMRHFSLGMFISSPIPLCTLLFFIVCSAAALTVLSLTSLSPQKSQPQLLSFRLLWKESESLL